MPGVRLLETADNFPKDGPILIITDGYCDRLTSSHEHAYLIAEGGRLQFPPKGPVFRLSWFGNQLKVIPAYIQISVGKTQQAASRQKRT